MASISVRDQSGQDHRLKAEDGLTVMEILREGDIEGIVAVCGGCCACATCHVIVDPAFADRLPAMSEDEDELLSSADNRQPHSRLSCQLVFSADLDGLRVVVPEEI